MQNSMRKVVAIALFLLSLNAALAQSDKGLLVGRVMSETGRPLVGAKLFVTGTQDSGLTDVEGKFSFSVAVGARKVFVEAEGHDVLEDSIFIEAGKEFFL
ncbi:MAG: CarboxypepD reg-like domain, partial [Bacteroidota bacterium]